MITVIDSKLLKNKIFSVNKTFITIPFFNILLNVYIDLYTEEDKQKLSYRNHMFTRLAPSVDKKKKKTVTKIIRLA